MWVTGVQGMGYGVCRIMYTNYILVPQRPGSIPTIIAYIQWTPPIPPLLGLAKNCGIGKQR